MVKLRDYQEEAVKAVRNEFKKGIKRTMLVKAVGLGKTVTFCEIARKVVEKGGRVLIVAHTGELIEQICDTVERVLGVVPAIEQGKSFGHSPFNKVVVATVQTLSRATRLNNFPRNFFNLVVFDEAHRSTAKSYRRVIDYFDTWTLGVTATPNRGDGTAMGNVFDSVALEKDYYFGVEKGVLTPIKIKRIPVKIDLNKAKVSAGDLKKSDVHLSVSDVLPQIAHEINENAVKVGRRTIIFTPLVKTSEALRDEFLKIGVVANEVNGKSKDRKELIESFKRGDYPVLLNSMLLTEGFDCPEIDCIVILRPTKSQGLFVQMVGRAVRASKGKKDTLMLDFNWLSSKHSLATVASLGGKEIKEEFLDDFLNENPSVEIDLNDLASATAELADIEEEKSSALEDSMISNLAKYSDRQRETLEYLRDVGTIDVDDSPVARKMIGKATDKQVIFLNRLGVPKEIAKKYTKGEAHVRIELLKEKRSEEFATEKQLRLLRRYYSDDALKGLTKRQAMGMIGQIFKK